MERFSTTQRPVVSTVQPEIENSTGMVLMRKVKRALACHLLTDQESHAAAFLMQLDQLLSYSMETSLVLSLVSHKQKDPFQRKG